MKKPILLILTSLFFSFSYAQVKFEKGYYIDNAGNRVECFIKNVDKENNPTDFMYKMSEEAGAEKLTIDDVSEFGSDNQYKYIRAIVDVDKSSPDIKSLFSVKDPEFVIDTIFLKVLVEGKASLFSYYNYPLKRYFYTFKDNSIEQLIYKKYLMAHDSAVKDKIIYDYKRKQHDIIRKIINSDNNFGLICNAMI